MPLAVASRSATVAGDQLPAPAIIEAATGVFSALADPNRLRLLNCLIVVDEMCVRELADAARMLESTTSHALRVLRLHGMVTSRRDGRTVFYALADDHVRHILADMFVHVQHVAADIGVDR